MIEIPLTQGFTAVVDDCDADLLEIKWHAKLDRNTVYGRTNVTLEDGRQTGLLLHRVIMERALERSLEAGELVDHKDLNGLNNTRGNLRIATYAQNAANKPTPRTNTSGMKGVYWHKHSGKWAATIRAQGTRLWLGVFTDAQEALRAYNDKAKEVHGEFARLDTPTNILEAN